MTRFTRLLRQVLPQAVADRLSEIRNEHRQYRKLKLDLAVMRAQHAACRSLDEQVDLVRGHTSLGAIQLRKEMTDLLRLLEKNPPKCLCEIGTAAGGTLFLLAQVSSPGALLLSLDLEISPGRSRALARFATRKQRIISLCGDSQSPEIIQRVVSTLHGRQLDLLFIDGDHSYEGVKADFHNYAPLVRPGGLIVFHDIIRDFGTRYGKPTGTYTGGVPVLWDEIKAAAQYRTLELVENPEQDGYGIGVLYK